MSEPQQVLNKTPPRTEAARLLDDLVGISFDLAMVNNWCRQALWYRTPISDLDIDSDGISGGMIHRLALQSAILITYRRCFTTGIRATYPKELREEALAQVKGDAATFHQVMYDQADKYIAHAVNASDQVRMGIVFDPNTHKVVGDTHLTMRYILGDKEINQIGMLSDALIQHLDGAIADQIEVVKAECAALTPEEIEALPDHKLTAPDASKPTKPRPR